MSSSTWQLTLAIQHTICAYIRAGGYPQVAAEAVGIPRAVFESWMQAGRGRGARKKYRLFYQEIIQAQAVVRLAAEAQVLREDPLTWLKSGPGRETLDSPGWTNPVSPMSLIGEEGINPLLHEDTQKLLSTLLQILQPYPDVRAAVADALQRLEAEASPDPDATDPEAEEESSTETGE